MPALTKQTNHRPVTLKPSTAKAPQLLLQACSRKTHVLSLLVITDTPLQLGHGVDSFAKGIPFTFGFSAFPRTIQEEKSLLDFISSLETP